MTEHVREGRALKYRAARTRNWGERADLFAQAAARYLAAARAGEPSTYALINAASLHAMAGNRAQGAKLAGEVLALLDAGTHAPDTPYWLGATRSEAELVMGDADRARSSLAQAVALAPRAWEDHAVALRQFRLLLGENGASFTWLEEFTPPPVLAYGGIMSLACDDATARDRIAQAIAEIAPCEAYGALAAGTDILAAEALLASGADLHVVLPADVDRFRAVSVGAVADGWGPRFDTCLAAATSVHVAAPGAAIDAVTSALAAKVAKGFAIGRAKELETVAIGLRATAPGGGNPAIGKAWDAWKATGNAAAEIELARSLPFAGFPPDSETCTRTVLAAAAPIRGVELFDTMADALAAARGKPDARLGLDVQAGEAPRDDMAIAAATAGETAGLWASTDALALARLAEPALDAELSGAVGHARGTSDLYRIYLD